MSTALEIGIALAAFVGILAAKQQDWSNLRGFLAGYADHRWIDNQEHARAKTLTIHSRPSNQPEYQRPLWAQRSTNLSPTTLWLGLFLVQECYGFISAIEVVNPAFDARPRRAPPQR